MGGSDEIDPNAPAAKIGGPEPLAPAASAEVEAVTASAGLDQADLSVAEAIASGQVDPAGASELIIEQVIAEQLPDASPEQIERLRAELSELLADDPTLASLLRAV
jgi:hypothetical protein